MTRFFFHLHNDLDVRDDEGRDLPDFEAAHVYAVRQARELIAAMIREQGRLVLRHRIDIQNEDGMVLDSIYFRDVVSIED